MVSRHSPVLLVLIAVLAGCGAPSVVRAGAGPDAPVAAAEPRGALRAVVDLAPTQGCEEKFDLALYQDRAVDLIQWAPEQTGCAHRTVEIRYLSSKTSAERITAAARQLAVRFEPQSQGTPP